MVRLSDIILEYGEAFHDDFLNVDGGIVTYDMGTIADACSKYGDFGLSDEVALELRTKLGLCPYGGGHWSYWCGESGCGR